MGSQLSALVEQVQENGGYMQEMAISKVKANKDKDVLAALEELAKQLPHLHALSAKECKLQKLPQEISALTSLAILNLEHNKLTTLPSMAKLDGHLHELHLPQNKFITFPSTLSEMVQLALLDLSSNAIAEIPKELEKMRGLRRLNISKNALTVFAPSICMLPALTSLDLSENRLITVPKQVGSLLALETLVLRRNALSHIPAELGACVALTNLDISENQILALPTALGSLVALTSLSAQHNKISELPKEIGELCQLRNLKLHDNQIEHLPPTFGQLTNLTEVCLQENELQELPAEIGGCTSLRKLYAEYNRLSSLPPEFAKLDNLVVLILHHNRLKEVPEALLGMRQLLRLSLDSNPLPEHVQEVIHTKGALGLLAEKVGTGNSNVGTMRGTLRNQMMASTTSINISPVPGSRGSVILSPRIGLERLQEMKKGLLPLLKGETSPRKSGSLDADSAAPAPETSILSRLRASSLTSEKLRSLSAPATVDSPEDEMRKFVENRRKTLRSRKGVTAAGLTDDLSSGPTILRAHSESDGVTVAVGAKLDDEQEKAQEKKEEKEEDIPSYSKFKYAFERMLTTQDFSSRRQETLKKLPANQKWKLLTQYKGSTLEMLKDTRMSRGKGKAAMEPQDYVPLLKGRPSTRDLEGLSTALESQASSWVAMFVEAGGIEALVALLNVTALKLRLSHEDCDVLLHALTAMKTLLGLSLRSVLTTSESVNCLALCAGIDNVQVKTQALEVLAMVLDVHYVGQRLVHEAFHNYKKVMLKGKEASRFARLMDPLIQSAYPTEALVNSMDIINTLIGDEEDLEARLDIRKEFVQMGIIELMEKLRLYSSELLHIQLDLFEEELEGDYEEMLSKFEKKKVLQRMESQGQSVMAEGAYLRVLLGHTGQQLVVPFEPTTAVSTAVDIILQKQPLAHPQDIEHYGLYHSSAAVWLDDPTALLCTLGSGEIVCEFKMRPLKLTVTKAKSLASSADEQRKQVSVDPNATVSSALALVLQQFGFKQDSATDAEGEDYGLVFVGSGTQGEVWLEDMSKLGEYKELFAAPRLALRRKPWQLKVSFPGHSVEEMPFEPDLKIADVIEHIIDRLVGPSKLSISSQDYGLFIRRKTHKGIWLKHTRTLSDYPELFAHRKVRPVELMLKPRSVTIVLPEKQRTMKLHFTDTVEDLLEKICTKAGLPVQQHSLYLQRRKKTASGDEQVLLNPAASLKEQNVPYTATLALGPKQEFVPRPEAEKTAKWSQNVWEEPSGEPYLLFEDAAHTLVRAGTLNKLVQHLTSEEGLFKAYDDAFIMTFQSFCGPDELFDKLMERFDAPARIDEAVVKKVRLRVCVAIRDFINAHYNSLGFPDCELATKINAFIDEKLKSTEGMQMHATMLQKAIATPPHRGVAVVASSGAKTKLRNMSDSISLFDMEELEVAKQLTLRTWDIYSKFQPLEFFKTAWSKPSTWHLSPNLLAAINFFNHVSLWVGTMIVTTEKVRERAKIMNRCVKIAQHLREMNNYQLLMAFVSGMNNSALLRLKWTRAKVPKRALTTLKELEEMMSMEGSFKTYRAMLESSSPPCIPYVGVYLTDLTFIEDGNADEVVVEGEKPQELINFGKRVLVYNIISTILRYQQQPYGFARHDEIQAWFESVTPLSENELYAQSLLREPRGAGRADIQ